MTLDELIERLQELRAMFPASSVSRVVLHHGEPIEPRYEGGLVVLGTAPLRRQW